MGGLTAGAKHNICPPLPLTARRLPHDAAAMARGLRPELAEGLASAVTERSECLPLLAVLPLFAVALYRVQQPGSCFVQARPGHWVLPLSMPL